MFGLHINKDSIRQSDNLFVAIRDSYNQSVKDGMPIKSYQVFIANPRNRKWTVDDEIMKQIREFNVRQHLKCIVHSTYLDHPWGDLTKASVKSSIGFIKRELEFCDKMKAKGLVVHLPTTMTPQEIEHNLIKLGDNKSKAKILLEMDVVSISKAIYNKPETLNELMKVIRRNGLSSKFGLVIDTAHVYHMGTKLKTKRQMNEFLNGIKEIGLRRSNLIFHLNDDKNEAGYKRDEHTCLTTGKIWSDGHEGLQKLVKFLKRNKLIAIFEGKRYDDYVCNMNIVQALF
ncbi:endonuclease 4 [uncultured archaeon]|nr:endonuclease 4 [uncultured archaeon]